MDESRKHFEEWVMSVVCISKTTLEGLREGDGYRNSTLSGKDYNQLWLAWQASRAAIEINLPVKTESSPYEHYMPSFTMDAGSVECAIRAAGIKIKE